MQVIEIDPICGEAPQTFLTCLLDVLGPPIDFAITSIGTEDVAELRRNCHVFAPPTDRTPDKLFVSSSSIDIGCVEKVYAKIESPMASAFPT